MIQYTSVLVAFFFSALFLAYILYENKQSEDKKDTMQISILSAICFVIVYMITNLVLDNNDDKQLMNHIKLGEPPF